MRMRAAVFVRRTGAEGLGHVGWAFDCGDGTFGVGSVENPGHTLRTRPPDTGFWAIRARDPIRSMRQRRYVEFKVIDLDQGDPARAWRVTAWVSRHFYVVFGHNCMNATYDILRAYGVGNLPAPARHWEPNHWFDHVRGRHFLIDADAVSLESEGRHPAPVGAPLPDIDSLLTRAPDNIEPLTPDWRVANTQPWHDLQAAMASAPPMPADRIADRSLKRAGIVAKIARLLSGH